MKQLIFAILLFPTFASAATIHHSHDGYTWKKATKNERLRYTQSIEHISLINRYTLRAYIDEAYNTTNRSILSMSVFDVAAGCAYILKNQ